MISENAGQSLHDKAIQGERFEQLLSDDRYESQDKIEAGILGWDRGGNMTDKQTDDILHELKNKISQKYQLTEMRLFGSKARGDSGSHSDIDISVRISDVNRAVEEDIFDLAYEVELKYGCLIDIFVFDDKSLNGIHFWAPVYQKILQEGLII